MDRALSSDKMNREQTELIHKLVQNKLCVRADFCSCIIKCSYIRVRINYCSIYNLHNICHQYHLPQCRYLFSCSDRGQANHQTSLTDVDSGTRRDFITLTSQKHSSYW